MAQALAKRPPGSEKVAEDQDISFSLRKSAISIEPFGKDKAARAFLRGLARFEPRVEVAREGLRHAILPDQREEYSEVILSKGSSADVRDFVRHSLHCARLDDEDDLVAPEREKLPPGLQMKVAKRMFRISETGSSTARGLIRSASAISVSAGVSAYLTELVQPGRLNLDLLFEPGLNVSKLYSIFFVSLTVAQGLAYSVMRSLNARRVRNDATEILESGKITESLSREVLKEIAGA